MGLMSKIKDMFFEEADEDDIQINDNRNKKEEKKEKVAKKLEFPKRKDRKKDEEEPIAVEIENKKVEIKDDEYEDEEEIDEEVEELEESPIIFDDEDFIEEYAAEEEETKEHVLYGGNYQKKEVVRDNKKFEPSPVISPVYGVLSKNYRKEDFEEKKDLDHLFISERKKKITFDSVRQKAYGDLKEEIESTMDIPVEKENKSSLLYDMEDKIKEPVVDKVTLGDAEEYFSDLGLEYNVDYIDSTKKTRTEKNKELSNRVEEETEKSLTSLGEDKEEKNLYDLIDMMYENKEE